MKILEFDLLVIHFFYLQVSVCTICLLNIALLGDLRIVKLIADIIKYKTNHTFLSIIYMCTSIITYFIRSEKKKEVVDKRLAFKTTRLLVLDGGGRLFPRHG